MAIFIGDPGKNIIKGTEAGDFINAGAGDDYVGGQNGGDFILGGDGNDTIRAGGGRDVVIAGNGNDRVEGNNNSDILRGNFGNDIIEGGQSRDKLMGRGDNDYISGGGAGDKIYGGGGSDYIVGGNGNDRLFSANRSNVEGEIDYFAFDRNDGKDRVMNFELGVDKIHLTGDPDGVDPSFLFHAKSGNTIMTYGQTKVTFKNVDLTTADQSYLLATDQEVAQWSIDNFGEVVI